MTSFEGKIMKGASEMSYFREEIIYLVRKED